MLVKSSQQNDFNHQEKSINLQFINPINLLLVWSSFEYSSAEVWILQIL